MTTIEMEVDTKIEGFFTQEELKERGFVVPRELGITQDNYTFMVSPSGQYYFVSGVNFPDGQTRYRALVNAS